MVGRLLEILSELAEEYELGAGGSASFSQGIHSETVGAVGASVSIIDGPDFSGGWLMGSVSGATARGGANGMVGWTPFLARGSTVGVACGLGIFAEVPRTGYVDFGTDFSTRQSGGGGVGSEVGDFFILRGRGSGGRSVFGTD
jgi:hypothetical protein